MHAIKFIEADSEYDWSLTSEVRVHANATLPFSIHTWRYIDIS